MWKTVCRKSNKWLKRKYWKDKEGRKSRIRFIFSELGTMTDFSVTYWSIIWRHRCILYRVFSQPVSCTKSYRFQVSYLYVIIYLIRSCMNFCDKTVFSQKSVSWVTLVPFLCRKNRYTCNHFRRLIKSLNHLVLSGTNRKFSNLKV